MSILIDLEKLFDICDKTHIHDKKKKKKSLTKLGLEEISIWWRMSTKNL